MPAQNTQQLLKLKVHPVILTLKFTSWWFVFGKMKETYLYTMGRTIWLFVYLQLPKSQELHVQVRAKHSVKLKDGEKKSLCNKIPTFAI